MFVCVCVCVCTDCPSNIRGKGPGFLPGINGREGSIFASAQSTCEPMCDTFSRLHLRCQGHVTNLAGSRDTDPGTGNLCSSLRFPYYQPGESHFESETPSKLQEVPGCKFLLAGVRAPAHG